MDAHAVQGSHRPAGGRNDAGPTVGVAAAVMAALAFSTEGLFAVGAFRMGADAPTALALRYVVAGGYTLAWLLWLRARGVPVGARGQPAGAETSTAGGAAGRARDLRLVFIGGVLAHGAVPRLLFESFAWIPTWLALLLFYLFPVMVTVGEHLLGRRRLDAARMVTVAVTLAGAALVANPSAGVDIHPVGVLLALAAAVCNASFLLALDPILARVPVHDAVAVQFGGGIVTHVVLLAAGGAVGARLEAALAAWPWLLGLGVITSGLAVTSLNVGIQRIGAARTSIIGMLETVFAVAWGVALLGEAFTLMQGIGAVLVMAGISGSIRGG